MTLNLLQGIRVVTIEQFISAPYCTQILAEAGAEVIKVERPMVGDPRRTYDPILTVDGEEISGGFASYNRGKLSVDLDLSQDQGRGALLALLATADVLVSNLRPGALARNGIVPAELRERFPSLVICEISGFGVTGGPYADFTAFDSVIQAMSGLSGLIGESAASRPLLAPMSSMDLLTGIWAALGIGFALAQRLRTGEGSLIDAAMFDIGAAFIERPLTLHEFTGEIATRGSDDFSPVGAFEAFGGEWISVVIPTDEMWLRCCTAMGRLDLVSSPQLDSVLKRAGAMSSLILPALHDWAVANELNGAAAAGRLQRAGMPAGVVAPVNAVRADEHLAHRAMFAPLLVDVDGAAVPTGLSLPRLPLLFDGRMSTPGAVPRLGSASSHDLDRTSSSASP